MRSPVSKDKAESNWGKTRKADIKHTQTHAHANICAHIETSHLNSFLGIVDKEYCSGKLIKKKKVVIFKNVCKTNILRKTMEPFFPRAIEAGMAIPTQIE